MEKSQKNILDIIDFSKQTLLDIVNDILDFSKLESHRIDLHTETVNLTEMIKDVTSGHEISAKNKLVQLTIEKGDSTDQMLDMLLSKKRAGDRKIWLENTGNLAEI